MRTLNLWMNGMYVGRWTQTRRRGSEFEYDAGWMASPAGRPLSLSLPFTETGCVRGPRVEAWFDNLLPDSVPLRRALAGRFLCPGLDAMALLSAAGRDTAGALLLLPDGVTPDFSGGIDGDVLTEADVAEHIREAGASVPQTMLDLPADDFLAVLAGAQKKWALLRHDGRWYVPRGMTPTTHILKLPLGRIIRADMSDSVDNEWLCLALLRAFGIPAAEAEIVSFEGERVLCVRRFDRKVAKDGQGILRLPQEDVCQAQGLWSDMKYEKEGGPGFGAVCSLLHASRKSREDLRMFWRTQVIFWMLRATDGHAKNFSVFMKPGGAFELAPLYDVISAWPVIGSGANMWPKEKIRLAVTLPGMALQDPAVSVGRRDFVRAAAVAGIGEDEANALVDDIAERTPKVVEDVAGCVPSGINGRTAERIFNGVLASARRLEMRVL